MNNEYCIAFALLAALFLVFSVIVMVGIYWCHYPYGRKGRRHKRR